MGAAQIKALLDDPKLPFGQGLCVEVGDSSYSKPVYLHSQREYPNLVTLTRLRGNRTLYHQVDRPPDEGKGVGHPTWYGAAFPLAQPEHQPAPNATFSCWQTNSSGQRYQIKVEAWFNMLMRGKRCPAPIPMHQYPFTLVRLTRYDEAGQPKFKRPFGWWSWVPDAANCRWNRSIGLTPSALIWNTSFALANRSSC
ncbi:MAG: transposase [Anaerolineae bacterium]